MSAFASALGNLLVKFTAENQISPVAAQAEASINKFAGVIPNAAVQLGNLEKASASVGKAGWRSSSPISAITAGRLSFGQTMRACSRVGPPLNNS